MFTSLHALAKQATLMITIAPEGDDQLRVNVTPVPFDTKAKSTLPQPLSLVATPTEFDADFIAALSTWQAPKRSLIQQAQDATGTALPAPAAADASKLAAPKEKGKPGRKPRGDKPGAENDAAGGADADEANAGAEQPGQLLTQADAPPVADSANGDAKSPEQSTQPPAATAPAASASAAVVDTFTIDLF